RGGNRAAPRRGGSRLHASRARRDRFRRHAGAKSPGAAAFRRRRVRAARRPAVVPQMVCPVSGWRVPFNRPTLVGDEFANMAEAVAAGHISGDGPFTQRCEALLAQELRAERVLLTTSCTHALELA